MGAKDLVIFYLIVANYICEAYPDPDSQYGRFDDIPEYNLDREEEKPKAAPVAAAGTTTDNGSGPRGIKQGDITAKITEEVFPADLLRIPRDSGDKILDESKTAISQTLEKSIFEVEDSEKIVKKRMTRGQGVEFLTERKSERSDLIPRNTKLTQQVLVTHMKSRYPQPFCELERDPGIICPGVRRGNFLDQFYYDPESNRCLHFIYNGCGGNANRFTSMWECTQSCASSKSHNQ